jgi:hypothetical protein
VLDQLRALGDNATRDGRLFGRIYQRTVLAIASRMKAVRCTFTRFVLAPGIVYGTKVDAGEALAPVGCGRAINGKGVG